MNMVTDVLEDAEVFFESAFKYFVAHIGEFAVQVVQDAVKAANLIDATGAEKKTFAFSNIVAAIGRDIVEGSTYMFNFCLEAAVAHQKQLEAQNADNAAPETNNGQTV